LKSSLHFVWLEIQQEAVQNFEEGKRHGPLCPLLGSTTLNDLYPHLEEKPPGIKGRVSRPFGLSRKFVVEVVVFFFFFFERIEKRT
jgi:hypothetical protein